MSALRPIEARYGITVDGSLVIDADRNLTVNNLTVSGTSNVVNTEETLIADNIITLNSNNLSGGILGGRVTTTGTGYTAGWYRNVPLTGGAGTGSTANITISSTGVISTLGTITAGTGYSNGVYYNVPLNNSSGTTPATGGIAYLEILNGGTGYTTTSAVSLVGGSGTAGAVNTTAASGAITAVVVSTAGTLYNVGDILTVSGGNQDAVVRVAALSGSATANITVAGGAVTAVSIVNRGNGYDATSVLTTANTFLGGRGSGFTIPVSAVSSNVVSNVQLVNRGSSYAATNTLSAATANVGGGSPSATFVFTVDSVSTGVAPTENAGIEVARGTSAKSAIIWNETTDKWSFTNDGSTYNDISGPATLASAVANGSSSNGVVTLNVDDATNTGLTRSLNVDHTTTGTAGVGIAAGIALRTENAAGTTVLVGTIDSVSTNVTNTTEANDLSFKTISAGTLAERLKISAAGNLTAGTSSVDTTLTLNNSSIATIVAQTAGTANVFNTVSTTGNAFGVAPTINLGISAASAGTLTVGPAITNNTFKIGSTAGGTINLTSDVTTGVVNAYTGLTTGSINIAVGSGASTVNLGGVGGGVNVGTITGDSTLTIRGNGVTGTASVATNVTTGIVNAFTGLTTGTLNIATGGGSTTNIGGAAGVVNIGTTAGNSILEVRGNSTTGTATIRTNAGATTVNVFNTVATTANAYGVATAINEGTSAGAASTFTFGPAITENTFKIGGTSIGNINLTTDVTTGIVKLYGASQNVEISNTATGATTFKVGTAANTAASTFTYGGAITGNIFKISSVAAGTINLTTDVTSGVANYFTSVTGTLNFGGQAVTANIGATTGNSILEIRGNATTGTSTIQTNSGVTTANVYNTVVTTGNAFGVATGINLGTSAAALSTLTFGPAINGNIFKIGGTAGGTINLTTDVTTGVVNAYTGLTTGTLNIATGGGSTTNIGGAASTVNIGTTGGNSILEVRGNSTTGTATIQTNSGVTTANIFNSVATTGNAFGVATAVNVATSAAGASTVTLGSSSNSGNTLKIGSTAAGTINVTTDVTSGTANYLTSVTGTLNFGGAAVTANIGTTAGNSILEIRGASAGSSTIQTSAGVTTANVYNTVVTTGNVFGVATTVNAATSAAAASTLTFGPAITGNTFKIGSTAGGAINLTTDVTTGTANIYNATQNINIANTTTSAVVLNIANGASAGASTLDFGGAISGNTLKIGGTAAGTINILPDNFDITGTVNLFGGSTNGITTGTMQIGKTGLTSGNGTTILYNNIAGTCGSITTIASTSQTATHTFPIATFRSAKIYVQVTQGSNYHNTEITCTHDGTNVWMTEYGTLVTGGYLASFDADISGGNVRLLVTMNSNSSATVETFAIQMTVAG